MKLVNTHKPVVLILLLLFGIQLQAQKIWSLQTCIDSAMVYNKQLKIKQNDILIQQQRQEEANTLSKPKLKAMADYKYYIDLPHQLMPLSTFNPSAEKGEFKEAQFGVPHNLGANLVLEVPIYNPQIKSSIENSKLAKEITEIQLKKSEEQLYFEISTLYYNAQILYHQLQFINSNIVNTNRLLTNMELLHEHKMATGTDVKKIALQLSQLQTKKENISIQYSQVLNILKLNMGIDLSQDLAIETEIIHLKQLSYENQNLLDIELLSAQNKLLDGEIKALDRNLHQPSFNFIASYGASGFGYDKKDAFFKVYPVGFAGFQLSYPILDGKTTQKKINQKRLEIENNQIQSDWLKEQNQIQLQNAYDRLNINELTIVDSHSQIELAQLIYDQTLLQQKNGLASLTEVLIADNSLKEAQQNYLAALIDFLKTDLELKKLSGNLHWNLNR